MKEKILLSLLSLCWIILPGQSVADYSINYSFQFVTDTSARTYVEDPEKFMLLRTGQKSRFMAENDFYNDSTLQILTKEFPEPVIKSQESLQEYVDLMLSKRAGKTKKVRSDYRVIKNFETGRCSVLLLFLTFPTQYMEVPMALDWELTTATDTLLGLPCLEARTSYGGRRYRAWFTPTIPISDGPYVFNGLPGLILKVIDEQQWYQFMVTSIVTTPTPRFNPPNWLNAYSTKITRSTYVDRMIDYKENPKMPAEVLDGISPESLLNWKKANEERFDLIIEWY